MITCIIADRQSGKTTFAINDILYFYKREDFKFFSQNVAMSRKNMESYLRINNDVNIKNFQVLRENYLRGVNLHFAIFDDYELFNKKARLELYQYPIPQNANWFILCSGNDPLHSELFYDAVKAVRNITTNNNLSKEERQILVNKLSPRQKDFFDDVIALPTTEVIYANNLKDVKNTLIKKWVARERIKIFDNGTF
jgi:hypothetical protein